MLASPRTARSLLVAVATLAVALPVVLSAGSVSPEGVTGVERADRIEAPATDVVTVYNSGELRSDVEQRAIAAAMQAGGDGVVGGSASLGMTALRRGGATVQAAPFGYAYPMGTTVLPRDLVARIMGFDVSGVMDDTAVVMSSTTAGLRGARAGDTVSLTATWGGQVSYTVAAVVDDAVTGGTELLMTPGGAARVGLQRDSRVVIYGFDSRSAIDQALRANGLVDTSVRIRRSWDPIDPDDTIGMARTKQLLGEFAYRVSSGGSVSVDSGWINASFDRVSGGWPVREQLNGSIPIRAACHRVVKTALQNALAEIAANGLSWTIEVANANSAGGCFYPRFNRLSPNSSIGFLSRHSWGMALDTNTVSNCQGCTPGFALTSGGCRTVRIFRKHGFAWGGNFIRPDGMHFEYVGERRDLLPYPSRFCANPVSALAVDPDDLPVEETERARLFQDDGLMAHGQESH